MRGRCLRFCDVTIAALAILVWCSPTTRGRDEWTVDTPPAGLANQPPRHISGVRHAEDASTVWVRTPDQRIWPIARSAILTHVADSSAAKPLGRDELEAQLRAMFPHHSLVRTEHYLICHDVDNDFARQAEKVLEQVYRSFFDFWRELDLPVSEPDYPLIVVMFQDANEFSRHVERELGSNSAGLVAFYGMASNQVAVRVEKTPRAEVASWHGNPRTTFATNLVHEAVHQLMCNSGMQTRFADYPLWVSEGLAAYFEPADPYAKNGWRRPGGLQSARLAQLQWVIKSSQRVELTELVGGDEKFRQTATAPDSYALAWGFNYWLLKRHRAEYLTYLRWLSQKTSPSLDGPERRVNDFQSIFKSEPDELSRPFMDFFSRL